MLSIHKGLLEAPQLGKSGAAVSDLLPMYFLQALPVVSGGELLSFECI
jgi:hypothetical protein